MLPPQILTWRLTPERDSPAPLLDGEYRPIHCLYASDNVFSPGLCSIPFLSENLTIVSIISLAVVAVVVRSIRYSEAQVYGKLAPSNAVSFNSVLRRPPHLPPFQHDIYERTNLLEPSIKHRFHAYQTIEAKVLPFSKQSYQMPGLEQFNHGRVTRCTWK